MLFNISSRNLKCPLTLHCGGIKATDGLIDGTLDPGPVSGGKILADGLELGGLSDSGNDGMELGSAEEVHGGTQLRILDVVLDQVADLTTRDQVQEVTHVTHKVVQLRGDLVADGVLRAMSLVHWWWWAMRTTGKQERTSKLGTRRTNHWGSNLWAVLWQGQGGGESSEEADGNVEFHCVCNMCTDTF